ncbi:hypothetical protein [Mycolicibacterium hippocampi]
MCAFIAAAAGWLWGVFTATSTWLVDTGPGLLTQLVSIATLLALLIAWRQLSLDRNMMGGRLFEFNAQMARGDLEQSEAEGHQWAVCEASVKLHGPGVVHYVALHLEVNGVQKQPYAPAPGHRTKIDPLRVMTAESPELRWRFALLIPQIGETKCVLSWVEALGEGVRTRAMRKSLTSADVEEWHWYFAHQYRAKARLWAVRHGPRWFRRRFGAARPLGEYRRINTDDLRPGEGPFELP